MIGVGVASLGSSGVEWGFCTGSNDGSATTTKCKTAGNGPPRIQGDSLSQIPGNGFAPIAISWFVSPLMSGIISSALFLFTRLLVLDDNILSKMLYNRGTLAENSFFRGLFIAPIIYGAIASVLVVLLSFKGVSSTSSSSLASELGAAAKNDAQLAAISGITGLVIMFISAVYVSLWQYRTNWLGEDLKNSEYLHFFLLAKRPIRAGFDTTHHSMDTNSFQTVDSALSLTNFTAVLKPNIDIELLAAKMAKENIVSPTMAAALAAAEEESYMVRPLTDHEKIMKAYWKSMTTGTKKDRFIGVLMVPLKFIFCYGLLAADGKEREVRTHNATSEKVHDIHASAFQYDDRTELIFRQLQMLTSCVASFAHGSNDVANAMGPLSTILGVYRCKVSSTAVSGSNPRVYACTSANNTPGGKPYSATNGFEVPIWLLALGGIMIGIGFCTYGFHIMRSLGNNLTYHSPSRGYCMEMGAAITVIIASRIGLPISTTQCITGATMAVGMLNGARGVNWKRFGGIFLSWIVTMPIVGIYAGLILLFLASNPNFRSPSPSE